VSRQRVNARSAKAERGNSVHGPVPFRHGEASAVARIPISSLHPSESPRIHGEESKHVQLLAESKADLPPIVVHRRNIRIIDVIRHFKTAVLRGKGGIDACLVDAEPEDIFVLAVEAKIAHGLPLPLADRKSAAARILRTHAKRSGRAIAPSTGLSPKPVGAIRLRAIEEDPQSHIRVGRDGRAQPLISMDGRRRASELLKAHPDASLRQVAQAAGFFSPSAVRDVGQRSRRHVAVALRPGEAGNEPTQLYGTASATDGTIAWHRVIQVSSAGSCPVNGRSAASIMVVEAPDPEVGRRRGNPTGIADRDSS
jgi:hypothetical protein